MSAFIRNIPPLKKSLRFGVIYVVTSIRKLDDVDKAMYMNLPPRLMGWLRSLTGFDIEVIESPDVRGTTLMARRINISNVDTQAVVEMPLTYESFRDVSRFVKSATDVLSTEKGDLVLEQEADWRPTRSLDYSSYCDYYEEESFQPKEKKSKRLFRNWFNRKKNKSKKCIIEESDRDYNDEEEHEMPAAPASLAPTEVELEEEKDLQSIEQQKEEALKAIQAQIIDYVTTYQADPSELIHTLLEGKIVIGKEKQQSPLVVNNDLKIVLPHYNELEVKMPAMCRTIYILFLKHPEGIALRNISDHRAELEDIYSMVMPGRSEERTTEAIDNLIDPMNNTLNEYISKIKRCFKTCIIDDELANKYCITGKRGKPYSIALDPALITLPRAVTE